MSTNIIIIVITITAPFATFYCFLLPCRIRILRRRNLHTGARAPMVGSPRTKEKWMNRLVFIRAGSRAQLGPKLITLPGRPRIFDRAHY